MELLYRLVVVENRAFGASPEGAEVVVRDRDHVPVGYGWVVDGVYWLRFPGRGTFRVRPDEKEVAVAANDELEWGIVLDTYRTAVLPLAYHLLGFEALHASAVRMTGEVVALCALSETGKSTLAYGLSRRDNSLWTDDALVLEIEPSEKLRCHPLPFTPHLRPETRLYFDVGAEEATALRPGDGEPLPLAALFLLERDTLEGGATVECTQLSLAEALPAVLPHGFRFSLSNVERKRHMMQRYLDLVAGVPVVRFRFTPGFELLPRVLDELESAVRDVVQAV